MMFGLRHIKIVIKLIAAFTCVCVPLWLIHPDQPLSGRLETLTDSPAKLWPHYNAGSNVTELFVSSLDMFFTPRVPGSSEHYKVQQSIKKSFQDIGWTVEEDSSVQMTPLGSVMFVNLIATLDPRASRKILVACHYDSKISPAGFLGAMDSAVPCAMMSKTLQMIFLDGEEALVSWSASDSLYGSRHLANKWFNTVDATDSNKNVLSNIEVFILLDLIGHVSTQFQRHFYQSDAYYTKLIEIEGQLRSRGLLTRRQELPSLFQDVRRPFDIPDDHLPFANKGCPHQRYQPFFFFAAVVHRVQKYTHALPSHISSPINALAYLHKGINSNAILWAYGLVMSYTNASQSGGPRPVRRGAVEFRKM
ncbi:hypothetical protein Btru_003239 [Bulinus truncatus]|nr:hypothetical protein Btru_003239 [Bulinus truncatus]